MRNIKSTLTLTLIAVICAIVPGVSDTASPNGGWDAAWSPDGARIAFTSGSPHGIPNLWVINADKSGLRQMTTRGAHEPVWLADGKTIVFGTLRRGRSVYMAIDAGGEPSSEKPVDVLPPGAEVPVWSPDGSLVAYGVVSKDGASRDLGFARASGGGTTGLTAKFWCREWTWSPDGKTIAFVVGRSSGTSIWTVDVTTKDVRLLYKGFCSTTAYSPDGKRLAVAVPDPRSGFKIVIINLATGLDKRIGVRTFDGRKLIWSTDGSRLFFASSRKSEPAIWSIGTNGKDLTRLTSQGMRSAAPALSPDGSKIAYQVSTQGCYSPELSVCSTTGRVLDKLTASSSPSFWSPVWSPNGEELAFQSDVNHASQLLIGSAAGRVRKVCTRIVSPDPAEVSWFPDGKTLLLADAGRLLVINKSGAKDAAKPFPKLANQVQGARLSGDEVIVTEWANRDATLTALKIDGSGRRPLTKKPEAQPKPQPDKQDQPDPSINKAAAPSPAASTKMSTPERAGAGPESVGEAESGNPHSDLGLMGPQRDLSHGQQPPTVDLWPAVSPDHKLVAFVRHDQIRLINADGTGEREITKLAAEPGVTRTVASLCWSPNGDSLLFLAFSAASDRLTLEIWMCRLEAGSERLIYSERADTEYGVYYSECTSQPAFMDGGSRVLFTSISTGEPRVVSMGLDGSDLREIVPAPSAFPALDRSGKKLAYVDLSNCREMIRAMDMATGKRTGPLFRK